MFIRLKTISIARIIGVIILAFIVNFAFVDAADYVYRPLAPIPGSTESEISTFPGYLKGLYKFAVWSVGIAALLMISIGGFTYFTAAGNASKAEKAKSIITDALWGVVAVMLAWFMLNIINPDILEFDLAGNKIFNL
ncbi:hypothetical protein ACFL2R_00770 [Patescibacteria group bacterium]